MTTHTSEPWRVSAELGGDFRARRETFILAGDECHPEIIASIKHHRPGTADRLTVKPEQREANAARIVACVNALAGIDDPVAAITAARGALTKAERWHNEDNWRESPVPYHAELWLKQAECIAEALNLLSPANSI